MGGHHIGQMARQAGFGHEKTRQAKAMAGINTLEMDKG